MDIKKEFGKRVKERRLAFGFNQTQFGQLMDLTRASIINVESGRHFPTLEGFYKLCCILECDPNDLLPPPKKLKQVVKERVIIKRVIKKDFKPVKL